jgi:hypothetical protein
MNLRASMILGFAIAALAGIGQAGVIFSDTFSMDNGQINTFWNNEFAFVVQDGAYSAVTPNNNPLAVTTIKNLTVTDATVDVDILGSVDGGIMLHTQGLAYNGNMNGVLLVVKPGGIYWHVVHDGGDWTVYSGTTLSANPGTNLHITVQITGNTYDARAYRLSDGQLVGQTILVNSTYHSGGIGIYDFSGAQRFDNVTVSVPKPGDANLNGCVNLEDLSILASHWGDSSVPAGSWENGNFNNDNIVDTEDLLLLADYWLEGCNATL